MFLMYVTKDEQELAVEKLSWKQALHAIGIVCPELSKLMVRLNDDTEHAFYKASYPFGSKIIENKKCYLPLKNGGVVALNDLQLPDDLYEDLSYNEDMEDPLALILCKTSESYVLADDAIEPHALLSAGSFIGIPRATNKIHQNITSNLLFNLNAGARSLFMLSDISEPVLHKNVQQKYKLTHEPPCDQTKHWSLFVEMAHAAKSTWRCEIIYFPRSWINSLQLEEWSTINNHLLFKYRETHVIKHNLLVFWQHAFNDIEQTKHMQTAYPVESLAVAKQLLLIAAGGAPGFAPAIDDECAPIELIKSIYTKAYQLDVLPIIMTSARFNKNNPDPVYYWLRYPYSQPMLSEQYSVSSLELIAKIIGSYINSILDEKRELSVLYEMAKKVHFSYYHPGALDCMNIKQINELAIDDPRFVVSDSNITGSEVSRFPACIKIAYL